MLVEVVVRFDGEFMVPVHASAGCEPPEHMVGVGIEVRADPDGFLIAEIGVDGAGPVIGTRGLACFAASKDEQVADDARARGGLERAGREADSTDQVGEAVHLTPGRGVAGIEGVAGADGGDDPTRSHEAEALDQEVVVQRVTAPVVDGVVRGHLGEGDVADRQVEARVAELQVFEALCVDRGTGAVEVLCDPGGGAVSFDADDGASRWCQTDEVAGATARLENPAAVETEVSDGTPNGPNDRCRRVVGVEGGAASLGPCLVSAEQTTYGVALLGELGATVVEDLRETAPTRPTSQNRLVVGVGDAVVAESGENLEGCDVGCQLRLGSGRSEVVLAGRTKRYEAGVSVQVGSSELSVSFTSLSLRCVSVPVAGDVGPDSSVPDGVRISTMTISSACRRAW